MARKNLDNVQTTDEQLFKKLQETVELFALNKEEYDKYDKAVKAENSLIKDLMKELNLTVIAYKDWKVTYSVAERKSMDEDMLLEVLKHAWTEKNGSMECPYIKTKQYVDMDALEAAIYNGQVSDDTLLEMKKCESCKEVVTLRLSKNKGGNDE